MNYSVILWSPVHFLALNWIIFLLPVLWSTPEGIAVLFNEQMRMSTWMDITQEMETKYTKENNFLSNQSFTLSLIPTLSQCFCPSHPIQIVTSLHFKSNSSQVLVFYKIFNTSFQVEKLPDGKAYWLSVVLCFILFPFAWAGGCLVMSQLSNKFVPCEKLLTKNALYQSSVGFVCGSGSCTMPWHTHQLSVL